MTYRELAEQLAHLNDEQLDSDVTVYDTNQDEYFGCYELVLRFEEETDVLDEGHPFLAFGMNKDE